MRQWLALLPVLGVVGCADPFGMDPPHAGAPCTRPSQCGESDNPCEIDGCIYGFCDGTVLVEDGALVRNGDGGLRECKDGDEAPTDQEPDCPGCKGAYELCEKATECLSTSCAVSYAVCGGQSCCAPGPDGHVAEYDD